MDLPPLRSWDPELYLFRNSVVFSEVIDNNTLIYEVHPLFYQTHDLNIRKI